MAPVRTVPVAGGAATAQAATAAGGAVATMAGGTHVPAAPSDAVSQVMARVTEGLVMELLRSRAAVLSAREELGNIVRALEYNVSYYERDRAEAVNSAVLVFDSPQPLATDGTTSAPLPTGDVAGAFACDTGPSRLVAATLASAAVRPLCGLAPLTAVQYTREGLRWRLRVGRRRVARLAKESQRYLSLADKYLQHRVGVGADASALDGLVSKPEPWSIAPPSDDLKKQARDPSARANAQAVLKRVLDHGAISSALVGDAAISQGALDEVFEEALGADEAFQGLHGSS